MQENSQLSTIVEKKLTFSCRNGGKVANVKVCFYDIEEVTEVIKIISDSTCDLSRELVERYDVEVIPLHILLGESDFEDGRGITPDDIYRWADENKAVPKTSACNQEYVKKVFKSYLEKGMEIVCFSISSQMSSTYNVMNLVAQQLNAEDRISVVDSANLSSGVGLLVVEAAEMAKQGMSRKEIVARIEELKPLVRASFVVDTLTYLHRGGRCSGVAAMLGSTLKLHPQISVTDGKMHPGKKFRGKMARVIASYVEEQREEMLKARKNRVFLTHSGCEPQVIDGVYAQLKELNHFDEILICRAGGVISSHCGPGTLGVLYIAG